MQDLGRIKQVAVEAAREAGEYALERVGKLREISHKGGITNLVTDVDKHNEKIIISRIKDGFPSHSILAEESGTDPGDDSYLWLVDPLDGTTNYAHGFPVYCVSIGVMSGGSIKVGVVYDPSRDELFVAEENGGAYMNGNRLNVSERSAVCDSLLVTGFAYNIEGKISNIEYFTKMLGSAQAVRRVGSAAIDLCYVACGRFDGFWELGLCPWDTAAGQLIVKEAGGNVTLMNGDPFDVYKEDIVATNGKIHGEMLDLLKN